VALLSALPFLADTGAFTIVDDPSLDAAIAQVRDDYLAMQVNTGFTRLDCTLLIPAADGTWRRGSHGPGSQAYPASCVKLAYLAAAMRWAAENGHPYDDLDADVRPMIEVSDNYATGRVVDAVTGAPNIPDCSSQADPRFPPWYAKRLYTEAFLSGRGLLEGQTVLHKTYPTNSGSSPSGAELVAKDLRGGNLMAPSPSASLMLEIVRGAFEPGANLYMRGLLAHDRLGEYSSVGFGLPPGSVYENKIGVAYDTAEDIAHVVLPNGREFVLAVYTNGYDATQPLPYDADRCGPFTEMLVESLGLCAACPPNVVVNDGDPGFGTTGAWTTGTVSKDKRGPTYAYKTVGSGANAAAWDLDVPEDGTYEVAVWYPQGSNRTKGARYTVSHAGGSVTARVSQQLRGGRWVVLGNFEFAAGGGAVTLSDRRDAADPADAVVVADAVRATKIPVFGSPGAVPDGEAVPGVPLTLERSGSDIAMSWGASCSAGANDYAVYGGMLGDWGSHAPVLCSTGGETAALIPSPPGSVYFLVVPRNPPFEGSYGADSSGNDRPRAQVPCAYGSLVEPCP
jgi:protein phosphatase methylesterase 1